MVVNGTSYAALGWRPRSLTAKCRNFPQIGKKIADDTTAGNKICFIIYEHKLIFKKQRLQHFLTASICFRLGNI